MTELLPEANENEQEQSARDRVEKWRSENPAISNLGMTELSLLKQMITAPEEWRKEQVFLICDFMDHDEAYDHVAAYYEAKDLGMDTGYNIAYMFACAASSEKFARNNRITQLLDSLSHFRYTTNTPKEEAKKQSVGMQSKLS